MTTLVALALWGCSSDAPDRVRKPPPGDTGTSGVVAEPALRFEGERPTNLLILSVDTLRQERVDLYGAEGLTPFLASLSDRMVIADDCIQCSNWTFGGTTCTQAGATNLDMGFIPRIHPQFAEPNPPGTPFLSTWLREAGFHTVLSTANLYFSSDWGDKGFHEEFELTGAIAGNIARVGAGMLGDAVQDGRAPGPWYLHLHFFEPHGPYQPDPDLYVLPPDVEPWPEDLSDPDVHGLWMNRYPNLDAAEQEQLRANLEALYDGDIRTWDRRLGNLWTALDAEGWLDDTLVVFWSDHGEQFWEHGYPGHAYTLNYGEMDAVLAFWANGLVPGRHLGPVSTIDVVPTVLEALALPIPPEVTGLPLGLAPSDRTREATSVAKGGGQLMVDQGGLKLVYHWDGRVAFYDRRVDPAEAIDTFYPQNTDLLPLWTALVPRIHRMAPIVEAQLGPPVPVDGLPW